MDLLIILTLIFSLLVPCGASYSSNAHLRHGYPSVSVIETIYGPKNLENLVVQKNGNILVTSTTSPSIYQVSVNDTGLATAVATIPNAVGLLSIVELQENVFFFIASNLTSEAGSNEVWKLELNGFTGEDPANLTLLARIHSSRQLNGMTRLSHNDTTRLLISDSGAGEILSLDVNTGIYDLFLADKTLSPSPTGLGIGVNGIRTWGDKLFFVNTDQGIFASVHISLSSGRTKGPIEILVNGTLRLADDFALSHDGRTAWIAENGPNVLIEVDTLSKLNRVAVNNTLLASASSVALGASRSERSLFVTGAGPSPVTNGTSTAGRLFRVILD